MVIPSYVREREIERERERERERENKKKKKREREQSWKLRGWERIEKRTCYNLLRNRLLECNSLEKYSNNNCVSEELALSGWVEGRLRTKLVCMYVCTYICHALYVWC